MDVMKPPCERAARILADLDRDRDSVAQASGQTLVWDGPELALRDLIVDVVGRAEDLAADYAQAEDAKTRVKLSAEMRQLEIVQVRLLRQFRDVSRPAAPMSRRSQKAAAAARVRWSKTDAG